MRSLLLKAVLGLSFLAMLALCALTSPRTSVIVKPKLEQIASAALGAEVTIGHLQVTALPLGVVADDIEISPDQAEPNRARGNFRAALKHLRIQPALLRSLLWRRPTLAWLEADGLSVTLDLPASPEATPEAAKTPLWPIKTPLPIDVIEAVCTDIDLRLVLGDRAYESVGLSAHLGPYWRRARPFVLNGPHGTITDAALLGQGHHEIQVHMQGVLDGHLHRPETLHLEQSYVQLLGGQGTVDGAIDLTGHALKHAITVRLQTTLAALGVAVPALRNLDGQLWAQAVLARPFGDVDAALSLTVDNLKALGSKSLGQLRLRGQVGRNGLWIEQAAFNIDNQERLFAEGHVAFVAPQPFELTLQLHGAPLDVFATFLTGKPGQWAGKLGGLVMVQGNLGAPIAAHSSWNVTAEQLTLTSHQQPETAILAIPSLSARGQLNSNKIRTVVHNFSLSAGPALLTVDGEVRHRASWPSAGPYLGPVANLRLWAGGFDLEHLGPIVRTPYGGIAGVGGTLTGPLLRPHLHGHAHIDDFVLGPYPLGDSDSTLRFDAPNLTLTQLTVRREEGLVHGALTLNFGPLGLEINTALTASNVDAGSLAATLGLPAPLADRIDGALFGPVNLSGPLLRPLGTAVLATPNLVVDQVPLGAASANVRFGNDDRRIDASLTTQPVSGSLKAHVILQDDRHLHADLTGRRLPINVVPALGKAEVSGLAALEVNVEGMPGRLTGGLTLNVDNLAVRGLSQGGIHVVGRLRDQAVNINASLLHGSVHAAGNWRLGPNLVGHVTGGIDALNLATYLPLLSPRSGLTADSLTAVTTGSFDVAGPFAKPDDLRISATLAALTLGTQGTTVKLRQPVAITVDDGMVRAAPLWLVGPVLNVKLLGALPLAAQDPRLDVSLKAQGDLAALVALTSFIDAGHGQFSLQVAFSHTLAAPRMLGDATIHHGSLRLRGQDKSLEHMDVRAVFTGRTAAITLGRATLGDGRLSLAGEANVGTGSWQDPQGLLSLRLRLHRVPFRPAADVDAVASGNLELTGGLSDNALRGDLTLDALRYTARIDLDKLVPKRAAPPLRAPMMPAGRATRLAVHLKAPGNLLISSPVLEAELSADLTISGTTDRVGLIGGVTPLWARAKWNDNLFVLTRSSIDFVDEYRLAPQFNVVAHTRACQMDADVQIQGSVEGLTVTPSGRDERGMVDPQDVLTCLQFGLRLRDFNGNQHSGAAAGALSSGLDALWTVSGLDAKVRQFLPIAVDELRLTSSWSSNAQRTTPRILVAKELGNHVSMRYSRSIDEYNDQSFSLEYSVAEHLSLQTGWLTARDVDIGDFGMDLRLHWSLR